MVDFLKVYGVYQIQNFTFYSKPGKPILLYASDFWGCHKLPVNNPIDRLFNSVCTQMFGVQKNTSSVKATVKNWKRLRVGKGTPLILLSYQNALAKT